MRNKGKFFEIISLINPKSPATEAYQTLHTNIHFFGLDEAIQSLTVTSAASSEGKSTTCINLAIAYSQAGKHVLLVDTDLRRPTLHKYFGLKNHEGLTNVLVKKMDLVEAVHPVKKNLSLLLTGPIPPNSVELLNSKVMSHFMESVKEQYDVIIYDTPPIGILTDGAILAGKTDGTLLVIASGKSQIPAVQQAKVSLMKVNARLLGAVYTRHQLNSKDRQGYEYYNETAPAKKRRRR